MSTVTETTRLPADTRIRVSTTNGGLAEGTTTGVWLGPDYPLRFKADNGSEYPIEGWRVANVEVLP